MLALNVSTLGCLIANFDSSTNRGTSQSTCMFSSKQQINRNQLSKNAFKLTFFYNLKSWLSVALGWLLYSVIYQLSVLKYFGDDCLYMQGKIGLLPFAPAGTMGMSDSEWGKINKPQPCPPIQKSLCSQGAFPSLSNQFSKRK